MTLKYHINLFQSEPDGASGLDREDLSTACKFLEPSLADASVQPKGGPCSASYGEPLVKAVGRGWERVVSRLGLRFDAECCSTSPHIRFGRLWP